MPFFELAFDCHAFGDQKSLELLPWHEVKMSSGATKQKLEFVRLCFFKVKRLLLVVIFGDSDLAKRVINVKLVEIILLKESRRDPRRIVRLIPCIDVSSHDHRILPLLGLPRGLPAACW